MAGKFAGDPGTTSLQEARDWVATGAREGVFCPCCQQFAKIYKRRITSSMAYSLGLVFRYFDQHPQAEWLHVPGYLAEHTRGRLGAAVRSGDFAKLTLWGLVVEKPEIRDDRSPRAGYYTLTPLGRNWVQGYCTVPKYVYIYDGKTIKHPCPEQVTIRHALGDKFSYDDLMRA